MYMESTSQYGITLAETWDFTSSAAQQNSMQTSIQYSLALVHHRQLQTVWVDAGTVKGLCFMWVISDAKRVECRAHMCAYDGVHGQCLC